MSNPKKTGFFAEFRAFATRGNVLDMAVGVILATAFGKITSTLVTNICMPLFGYLFGGMDFSQFDIVLREAAMVNGVEVPAIAIGIGALISAIIDFILIAFSVFVVIKLMNSAKAKAEALRKKEAEAAEVAAASEPSREELLLAEIRDLLKERR